MTHQEFTTLTMREGQSINTDLYQIVEYFYMSDNNYHRYNNPQGIDEDKQSFCKRVYGGKVNTAKTILAKTISESQKENRYALQGNASVTKTELDRHDRLIANQYTAISKW